jgi:SAM-dependent MidA family methyltransferase
MEALPERLARAITLGEPMPVSQFMRAANAHYYAHGDPLGRDFITAPEISQMFGELIGAWAADLAHRAGATPAYVELGPGRGTLAADALRVLGETPVHFVETSPALRAEQARRVPHAAWHDDVATLPDGPLIVIANEFFDALPIRQLVKSADGWRERLVACQDTLFLPVLGKPVPPEIVPERLRSAAAGSIIETSPAAVATMRALARRLVAQGGALLVVDYGYDGPALGETLQAVRAHAYANPFADPGQVDLSAHVDFATLAAAAFAENAMVHGPVSQRDFLGLSGIDARAAALAAKHPGRAQEIAAARERLMSPDAMGMLFRAMAVVAPGWPAPAAFG